MLEQQAEAEDWAALALWDNEAEVLRWQTALLPELRKMLNETGAQVLADFSPELVWDTFDPRVRSWLAEREQMIKAIVGNREAELRTSLADGYEQRENLLQLRRRVEVYGAEAPWKAERIARTEVVGAMGVANYAAGEQAGGSEKVWVATRDIRVRDAHALLDGTRLQAKENFQSEMGGMGPGPHLMDSAADQINCRCTLDWYFAEEAEEEP